MTGIGIGAHKTRTRGLSGFTFVPIDMGSDLYFQYRDQYVLGVDPDIATWTDLSGGNDATQGTAAARPHRVLNSINGEPIARSDGTDDFMDTGSAFQTEFRADFALSMVIEFPDGNPTSNVTIAGTRTGAANQVLPLLRTGGELSFTYSANSNSAPADTDLPIFSNGAQQPAIITFIISQTGNISIRVFSNDGAITNGVQALDATNDGDMSGVTMTEYTSTREYYLFARNNNGVSQVHSAFDVAEKVFYSHSVANVDNVEKYMGLRYGITL